MVQDLGPAGSVDGVTWRAQLGLDDAERPVAVIVEGTWWREQKTRRRLAHLDAVRELGVPDVFIGRWGDRTLLYACPYGAPRTAEVVHMAALVGVRLAVQIGSCGVLGDGIRPGDVIVPTATLGLDGVTPLYTDAPLVAASAAWVERAAATLGARDIAVHRGPSVTWPTLFNQPIERVEEWSQAGYLGVDMETATTFAVARFFDMDAVSMLVAWDELRSGRSFLDPLSESQATAFAASDAAIFSAALEIVDAIEG